MAQEREKIIQIAVSGSNLYALTSDGNIMVMDDPKTKNWTKVKKPKEFSDIEDLKGKK